MARSRSRIVVGIAVLLALQGAAIALYLRKQGADNALPFVFEMLTPREAPALAFQRVDGTTGTLGELAGKVVMVHFWATWCKPCREELPGLLALARDLEKSGGFELLAVAVDDSWVEMRQFFNGDTPRSAVRPDTPEVHLRFGASTLPDTYLVDAAGRVVVRYAGTRDWRSSTARDHLEQRIRSSR